MRLLLLIVLVGGLSTIPIINANIQPDNNSPLLDASTAMFHHVEHTKTCGNNLQRLGTIQLEPLWLAKFDQQIKKTLKLTNSLNHLISNVYDDKLKNSKSNSNNNYNVYAKDNNVSSSSLNFHIIESHMLSSLSYFMFSSSQLQSSLSLTKNFGGINSNDYVNDAYIRGYGVVLFNENNDNLQPSTNNNDHKCLYISNALNNHNVAKNKSCLALNINPNYEKSALSDVLLYDSDTLVI
jgi:hypothetical protein